MGAVYSQLSLSERRDLEALRDAIRAGLDSGPGIPADQVFAELRARLHRQVLSVWTNGATQHEPVRLERSSQIGY